MERRKRILSFICAFCILVTGYSNLLSYTGLAGVLSYSLMASDGNTYRITVTYDENSGIPESAKLKVREIIQEETEPQNDPGVIDAEQTANDAEKEPTYKDYVEKSAELLGEETVTFARVFDITLVDSVTGEVYQPNKKVKVSIKLLDSDLSDDTELNVIHFGKQPELLSSKTKKDTVEFSTDGFSVYAVISTVLEQNIEASDGKTYKITVKYDSNSGLPSNAKLAVAEIPEESDEYAQFVAASADKVGQNARKFCFARAFDITIIDADTGETYQPTKDVKVSIKLLDEKVDDDSNIFVVHFRGSTYTGNTSKTGDNEPSYAKNLYNSAEVLNSTVVKGAVQFESTSFSVYVVIEHEGGEVENPRVEFHYIDSGFTNNGNDTYTAGPFKFINKKNGVQITQILKNGETLEMIANPPNLKDNEGNEASFFYGWYKVELAAENSDTTVWNTSTNTWEGNITYSWSEDIKVDDEIAITITTSDVNNDGKITAGDKVSWQIGTARGEAVLDNTGTAHVYLAPAFEDFYFVNYHMGNKEADDGLKNNLLTRRLVVFGTKQSSIVHIGDIQCPSPDPEHQIFSGWETVKTENGNLVTDVSYRTVDNEGNEITKTVNMDGTDASQNGGTGYYVVIPKKDGDSKVETLDIYPVFAEARWLHYDIGESGNDALYVASAYRLTNDDGMGTTFESLATSTRSGYTFDGWYVNAAMVGSEIKNLEGQFDLPVTTNENTVTTHYNQAIQLTDGNGAFVNDVKGKVFYITPGTPDDTETDKYSRISYGTSLPDGAEKLFEITSDGKLYVYKKLNSLKVGAKWTPVKVKYTVVYWLENANDDEYGLMYYKVLEDFSGRQTSAVATTASDTFERNGTTYYPYAEYKLQFAHLAADQDKKKDGDQSGIQQQTIAGDGSTIVNVYYDRNRYTLRFDIGYSTRSNNGSTTDYVEISPADAATYNETVYGIVNGSLVELTRAVGSYTYSYSPTYTASTAQESTMYGIVNGQYVQLDSTPVNGYGYTYTQYETAADNEGTQYALVGDEYVELTLVEHPSYNWKPQYTYASTNARSANTTYYGIVSGEYVQLTIGSRSDYYFVINGINTAYYSGLTRYSIATNNNGTQYAIIDGGLVELTRANGQWYYNGAVVTPSTRYTQAGNNTYKNTYVFVEGEMCALIYDQYYYWYAWYYNGNVYSSAQSTNNLASILTITGGTNYTRANYSGANLADGTTRYKLENGSYVIATDNEGTQYYYDGVGYVPLNRTGNTTYTWQYEDSNGDTVVLSGSDTRYKVGSTSVAYDGARYTRSGSLWNYTYTPTTADAASGQWGVDSRGGHVELTGTTSVIGYTYSANGADYTGTRYKQSNDSTVYTGTRYSDANCTTTTTSDEGTQYGKDENNVVRTLTRSPVYKWTYTDANNATQTYTGTLYQKTTVTGTTTYYVSYITNSSNYNQFLSGSRASCGTTIPLDFIPCGRYNETYDRTEYTIYYYDLTAKYGERIDDRWPDLQPDRPNNYAFIGWIAQPNSYYWEQVNDSSIKSKYTVMDEGIIGIDRNNTDTYTAITAENGITHEFRCRYQNTNIHKYFYRIYYWDPVLEDYPTTPNIVLPATSQGVPSNQAVPSYTGYTEPKDVVKKVIRTNENNAPQDITASTDNYSAYSVSYADYNAMIMCYYYRPNSHYVSYKYGEGSGKVGTEFSTASKPYYYDQSLADANVNQAEAVAATPEGYKFAGWYDNQDGVGSPFAFTKKDSNGNTVGTPMPDNDIILYAVYKPVQYLIKINPNGAEIDHIDHSGASYAGSNGSVVPLNRPQLDYAAGVGTGVEREADPTSGDKAYNKDRSTYFFNYHDQMVGEYAVSRSYVPIGDTAARVYTEQGGHVYAYVNNQFVGGTVDGVWGVPADLRNALYVDATNGTGKFKVVNGAETTDKTELYQLYEFFHEFIAYEYSIREPGWWDCDGARDLSFEAWKATFVDLKDDGTIQLYRKCNSQENWVFLGWYKDNDTMPYDFNTPVKSSFTLTARWRLDGGYKIQYTPEYSLPNGDIINGSMDTWVDPVPTSGSQLSYTDGALTTIYKQPTNLTLNGSPVTDGSFIFRGWQIVSVTEKTVNGNTVYTYTPLQPGVYYDPGDEYIVDVQYADTANLIHMQAVYEPSGSSYRRPEVANLTLDANGGKLVNNEGNDISADTNLPWDGVGTVSMIKDDKQIRFTDIQSNAAVRLYRYATELTEDSEGNPLSPTGTNYFKHELGHLLLGFDDEKDEEDYIATYPADSIVSVQRMDDETIYAVWEPMVYIKFVNNTAIHEGSTNFDGGDVTFNITSDETEALQVITQKNGVYVRVPLTSLSALTIAPGEEMSLVFPKGDEKKIKINGMNTLGIGKQLIWNTSINGTDTVNAADNETVIYTHDTNCEHTLAHGKSNNTMPFNFEEKLLTDKEGLVVTFTAKEVSYALLCEDNFPAESGLTGSAQEYDYSAAYVQDEHNEQLLPNPSTCFGYEFKGWAYTQNATTADIPAEPEEDRKISDLNPFFTDQSNQGYIETVGTTRVRRLYAVWTINNEAGYVYVYKAVPEPGNQKSEFTFNVNISGTYKASGKTEQQINASGSFKLIHGEYAVLHSTCSQEDGWIETEITIHNPDRTVKKDTNGDPIVYTLRAAAATQHTGGGFDSTERIIVTEAAALYYNTSINIPATTTAHPITKTDADRKITWSSVETGGTVIFTNTRETVDIIVTKELVSNETFGTFEFHASYTDGSDATNDKITVELEDFSLVWNTNTTNQKTLTIPKGASLTVSEFGTNLVDYTVTAKHIAPTAEALTVTPSESAAGGVTTYTRSVSIDEATVDDTITFTNTLIRYPVRIIKVDQTGDVNADLSNLVEARFDLDKETSSIQHNMFSNTTNKGVFYESANYEPFYAGNQYKLTETWVIRGYEGLGTNNPVTITVSGKEGNEFTFSDPRVTAKFNTTDQVWEIRVKNQEVKYITVVAELSDPLFNQREFSYTYSYNYDSDNDGTPEIFNGSFTLSPTTSTPAEKELTIPKDATVFVVKEDVTQTVNDEGDTIIMTYDIKVDGIDKTETDDVKYSIAKVTENKTATFSHKRKEVEIEASKTVIADNTAGTFDFEVSVTHGNIPIKDYTVFDNNTTEPTDDLITDDDGKVTFSLGHGDVKTLVIPVGSTITVEETNLAADIAVFMTMPGRKIKLVDGRSDKVEIIGPTERQTIRVFNIPSICKVTDADGNLLYVLQEGWNTPDDTSDDIYIPAIFPTIKGAFEGRDNGSGGKIGGLGNYYQYDSTVKYAATEKHKIEMLIDYTVPNDDVVVVGAGYDMVFTTASTSARDGYPFRRTLEYEGAAALGVPAGESLGRAVLKRVDGSSKAFFTVGADSGSETTFKMSELILDGDGNNANLEDNVRGGCLTAYNSEVTIDHCVVYNFDAKQGGAVYTTGASLTVTNSIFDSCNSELADDKCGGGAIHTTTLTLTVTDSDFKSCTAMDQGGAIYHKDPAEKKNNMSIELNRCTFTDCVAASSGGVETPASSVTVKKCEFRRCYAETRTCQVVKKDESGNIVYDENGLIVYENKTIKSRNAGGLNIYANFSSGSNDNSTAIIENCSFYGCKATGEQREGYGGGMRSSSKSITIKNCTFADDTTDPSNPKHNEAKLGGGLAITNSYGTATISGCTFTNCMAKDANNGGGGIYLTGNGTLKDNSRIQNCGAVKGGGIYLPDKAKLTISDSTVSINNNIANQGGGIFITGANATLTVDNGTLSQNQATGYGGGAIRVEGGGSVTINNGTFSENVASYTEAYGGAVNIKKGTVTINGGEFKKNIATGTKGAWGGAIHVAGQQGDDGDLIINGGTFEDNSVNSNRIAYGGAISMLGSNATVTISGGIFSENKAVIPESTSANAYGGAIAIMEGSTLNLSGGTISGNWANNVNNPTRAYGAGIYIGYYKLDGTTVDPGCLKISGAPNFGGADTKNADETYSFTPGVGNLMKTKLSASDDQTNGGQSYIYARQDIYLAGYNGTVAGSMKPIDDADKGIIVTGNITSGVGSIWVWAEYNDHIHEGEQFGFHVADSVNESYLNAFRNARIDDDSGASEAALYGVKGNGSTVIWGYVSEMNYRKVILRKVSTTYDSLSGASFNVYKGTNRVPYVVKDHDKIKPDETLENLQSESSGVFWIGMLPYGTYFMEETTAPTGYSKKWYYLIVDAKGVFAAGFTTEAAAISAADAKKTELNNTP